MDSLNKTVLRGEKHTALIIGSGGISFCSLIQSVNSSEISKEYARHLESYLADAYYMLVKGEIHSESLRSSGEAANLFRQGMSRTSVITNETLR